jgi:ATP-dependent RNA helicase DeaD
MLFKEMMDIHPQIIQALEETQIVSPTEIQEQCIPYGISMRKSHIMGQAKTGSGKTLAFAIPIIQHINVENRHIQAVILVPTRELCKQNAAVFRSITKYKKVKIVEVYGGASIRVQIDQIRDGAQVIVATPGRLIDLVHQRKINFKAVNFVALDEADRMLDMGFLPDMEFLLLEAMKYINPRLFLFSATMMGEIKRLIYKFTQKDMVHEINVSKDSLTVENCDQFAFHLEKNKFWSLVKILNIEQPKFSIIFTKTKRKAQELCRRLRAERDFTFDFKVGFIHGDLTQAKREETIRMFRSHQLNCIVGTNVLARGLDFPQVSHVFQYDLPRDPEDYVHRIGRTARVAGSDKSVAKGKAISIVAPVDQVLLRKIEKLLKYKIDQYPITGVPQPVIDTDVKSPSTPESSEKNSQSKASQPKKYQHKSKKARRKNRQFDGSKNYSKNKKYKKKKKYTSNHRQKITSSAK